MSDMTPPEPDLDAIAASLRADASDVNVFFQVFSAKLLAAIPAAVEVERQRGLFKKNHPVSKMIVHAGPDLYEAELKDGAIACRHTHDVHGIGGGLPYSEELDFDSWLRSLVEALSRQAHGNAAATAALRSLVT